MEICTLEQNEGFGILAKGGKAVVVVRGCCSRGNTREGYKAEGYDAECGAHMKVTNSSTDGDRDGCGAINGGLMTMQEVSVDGTVKSGTLP